MSSSEEDFDSYSSENDEEIQTDSDDEVEPVDNNSETSENEVDIEELADVTLPSESISDWLSGLDSLNAAILNPNILIGDNIKKSEVSTLQPSSPTPVFTTTSTLPVPKISTVTTGSISPTKTTSNKKTDTKVINYTQEGLNELTAEDIKEFCRERGIKNYSGKNKTALITHVLSHPLNEPYTFKSGKSGVSITVNPINKSDQKSLPAPVSAPVGNKTSTQSIVAPIPTTPSYLFAPPPIINNVTMENMLDKSSNPAMNEFKKNMSESSTTSGDVVQMATNINKAANEEFLGVKF